MTDDSYISTAWTRAWAARDPLPSPPGTPMPAGGWTQDIPPPMSADQSGNVNPPESRLWWTPVTGPGYYYDADPNQAANDAAARALKAQGIDPGTGLPINPYEEPGLLAVVMAVGNETQRQAAGNDLGQVVGDQYNAYINTNAQADPTWNNAVAKLLGGWGDPAVVYQQTLAGKTGLYGPYTEAQVVNAKVTTDRYNGQHPITN